jgi:integrase/recombinase XerD
MQRFLEHMEVRNYSPRTVMTWKAYLRYFIAWCDERGLARPEQIDRPILERYQRHLFYYRKGNGAPLTVRSQQTRIVPLRRWFQWLVKQRHLLYNPAIDLDMPRGERRIPRAILTARESEMVLAQPEIGTARGLRDRAILETFYSTGIRRLELINLSVHDIDYERGTVLIRQGKGKKDRMIPIGERALAWIAAYRDRARPELAITADETTLFLSIHGGPIHTNRMSRLVKDYVDAANVGKTGACHLFRHTMATLMLENGADIRFIQAMLGHAELSTTEIYTQVGIRMLKMVHAATHPGKMPEAAKKKMEADQEPTAEDLMARLDLEAEEEGE